jgi:hypothetical protein
VEALEKLNDHTTREAQLVAAEEEGHWITVNSARAKNSAGTA